jgi:formylglycine-generating enzyme required for sulfatase activity/CheY-like chemotaxis protein
MNILIVDDEPGLAAGLAGWLEENGWGSPGVATTSDEAVHWINREGRVDVLVCDVAIEPVDGFTLREAIQAHLPKMRTVFISAYDLSEYSARMEGCQFLPKPVTGEALDEAIRSLFEPKAPKVSVPRPAPSAPATPGMNGESALRVVAATPRVMPSPKGLRPSGGPGPKPKVIARSGAKSAAAVPSKASRLAAGVPDQVMPETELPPDDLVGRDLGDYHIEAKIEQGARGPIYRALQTNMRRQVRLYTLDRELAQDPSEIANFMSNASAKANVRHPDILVVYEAGENQGVYYYSGEYIPCRSLRSIREAKGFLDERTALQAMKTAGGVLEYFSRENIAHSSLSDSSVLIGPSNRPRIANIGEHNISGPSSVAEEMRGLGSIIAGVLPQDSQALGVRDLAVSLAGGGAFPDWGALLERIAGMEPAVAPKDAFELEAQERAARQIVEVAKQRQRKSMLVSSAVSLALFSLALGFLWWSLFRPKGGDVRAFDRMIEVPSGKFIYQDGQEMTLPAFFIDEYEVTIGQYAEFLKYLAEHPAEAGRFDHPKQPKEKSHLPAKWADEDLATGPMPGYYTRAKQWGRYQDAFLDVNCPVFGVDWFDAYAYAEWKGRRLPSEEEWEKAARGRGGFMFPWGNEPDPKKVNSGSDFDPDPKKGGETDGYKRWAPVDAEKGDRSPFGVMGMAGNVSEWTGSFDADPQAPGKKIPVIRGGNWTNHDYGLTRRVFPSTDLETSDALGFRTASDVQPGAAQK